MKNKSFQVVKKVTVVLLFLFLGIISSCDKLNPCKNATVLKDCTGTYLRVDDKDYHVCNIEKTSAFTNGASVSVSFKKIEECNGSAAQQIVCEMLRLNDGWIEIKSIK
jgi:hypothetical protein